MVFPEETSWMTRNVAGLGLFLGLTLPLAQPASAQSLAAKGVGSDPTSLVIRHRDGTAGGWRIAETPNFRIWHNQPRGLAERTALAAEKARSDVLGEWFGGAGADWQPCCDVYVYAAGADFSEATGMPAAVPGFSRSRCEAGRVVSRRIDLHGDAPDWLEAVLPHEVAHVVLASEFGDRRPPPWANEGVAVLTEPRSRVDAHLRNLPRYERADVLFRTADLVQLDDYPGRRQLGPFYAQSVSLVEFLSGVKGRQTFTRFARDGLRDGYGAALRKHYGWGFEELDQRWRQYAFAPPLP
jgi:hypothetical protein